MALTVGEVAALSGVSVRALHHYDAIGLLTPSGRTSSGYRLYTDADLERLQQILFYRELGFALEAIGPILDDPSFDRRAALEQQRALLAEKLDRTRAVLAHVDRTLAALEGGEAMKKEEMFDDEAKARWGDTEAYAESKRRTSRYTREDWARMREEADAIEQAFADALDAGTPHDDPSVAAIAERHRRHIDTWFYPCSRAMHAALAELYVSDERFAAHYDARRPGLAQFVRDAIVTRR